MKSLSRVVWSEGMHLGPHHFQAQSRYFEDSIHFAVSSLWPYAWGVAACQIDAAALRNGTLAILHARGIFTDGLAFNMPESDELPPARAIADLFPPTRDRITVYLAIPPHRPDRCNTALGEEHPVDGTRFAAAMYPLPDETTGRDEKPIRLGRKNIQLLVDGEDAGDQLTIAIGRVERAGAGQFALDSTFIPPCLRITASERLMTLLRRLIEVMEDKSAALRARESATRQGYSAREIASYWFTHAVNASLLPLRHLCFVKHGHPEELYMEMSRFAGALSTFALESHPRSLPLYDHANPGDCFDALDRWIRSHLEIVVGSNIVIALERSGEFFWNGEVRDRRAFERSNWILALRSSAGDAPLIERAPRLVKVCSREFTPRLVERALPGLALTHLAAPPAAVSPTVETQYFGITKSGPCWDHIRQTGAVGIYIPGEIPDAEVQLIVVPESES